MIERGGLINFLPLKRGGGLICLQKKSYKSIKLLLCRGCLVLNSSEGQVELLGVKIIELFLRNVLPVLNFYSDETKFEAIAKGRSAVDTISFSDLFHFFFF